MATIENNNPAQGPDDTKGPQVTASGQVFGPDVRSDWYAITDGTCPEFHLGIPMKTIFSGNTMTLSATVNVAYGNQGKVWFNVFDGGGAFQGQSGQRDVNKRIPPPPP